MKVGVVLLLVVVVIGLVEGHCQVPCMSLSFFLFLFFSFFFSLLDNCSYLSDLILKTRWNF